MPDPREEGLKDEAKVADLLGGDLVPGSGSQWYAKLDVGVGTILAGLKLTQKRSLSLTRSLLSEVIQQSTKIGVRSAIPAFISNVAGERLITMRLDDFVRILQEEVKISSLKSSDVKRARADMPLALRRLHELDDGADTRTT